MENLEQVKKAVEIEVKHKYININGKSRSFSSFICSVLRNEIKQHPDNPKWKVLLEYFERYPMETVPARKKALERLVSVIKAQYIDPPKVEVNSNTQLYKQAGNSIVRNVLVAILGKMIPEKENIYRQ